MKIIQVLSFSPGQIITGPREKEGERERGREMLTKSVSKDTRERRNERRVRERKGEGKKREVSTFMIQESQRVSLAPSSQQERKKERKKERNTIISSIPFQQQHLSLLLAFLSLSLPLSPTRPSLSLLNCWKSSCEKRRWRHSLRRRGKGRRLRKEGNETWPRFLLALAQQQG